MEKTASTLLKLHDIIVFFKNMVTVSGNPGGKEGKKMQIKDLGDVIATRSLSVIGPSRREVIIKIGKPQKAQDDSDYYCTYQIIGIGNEKIKYVIGIDGIQALLLTLSRVGAELYASEEGKRGALRWLSDERRDLGFPVPDSVKDLLPTST